MLLINQMRRHEDATGANPGCALQLASVRSNPRPPQQPNRPSAISEPLIMSGGH